MSSSVIYLQSGFWKQLRADDSIDGIRSLMNVYNAILESELRTDISDDDFDSDSYLTLLWKRHIAGKSHVELYDDIIIDNPEDNAEELSAVYLTDADNAKCDDLGKQFGVVAMNSSDVFNKEFLFRGNSFLLQKNSVRYDDRYMQFQDKLHYPCNSMILIDPYLLSKKGNIESNLYSLLDAMLPTKKLQIGCHISIFSMIGDKNMDAANGETVYNSIKNIITAMRKGLNFDLTLYAISHSEEFHSRMLLTNNVIVKADDGFEVFKEDGTSSKNATFGIVVPRLVGDNQQNMAYYLRWITISKKRSQKQSATQFWGSRKNRLFDLVQ